MHQYFIKFKKTDSEHSWYPYYFVLIPRGIKWQPMCTYELLKMLYFGSFYRFNNILNAIGLLTILELKTYLLSMKISMKKIFINLVCIYFEDVIDSSVIMYENIYFKRDSQNH